jgi:hypothetical protein
LVDEALQIKTKYEQPKMNDAVHHAQQLDKMYDTREDFAAHNPRTTVYQLVQELLNMSNQ